MSADLFVSYSRRDRDAVRSWVQRLRASGLSVWLDEEGIDAAHHWSREICEAIDGCKVFLLMVSPSSAASEHVHREVSLAMDERKPILPLYLEPASIPAGLRYALAGIQHLELFGHDSEESVQAILRALARLGIQPVPPAEPERREPAPAPAEVPHSGPGGQMGPAAPRPQETPNNLPRLLTSFVGREREMAEVARLLPTTCLLTLTGAGGGGKTRLALRVAAELLAEYPDGVWLVELETLADAALLAPTIAATLGVQEQAGRSTLETLTEFLRTRTVLLILDNCEHLIAPCAQLAAGLLRGCPNLRILATSREPLGVHGETVIRVPTLSVPDRRALKTVGPNLVATLLQFEAVQLFLERARAAQPSFDLTEQNGPAIAHVCQRLDGIPLAIELAAARVKVLSVEQIAQRLDDRFRLLTGGSRTVLPRQQTLRATIDWSYELLSETERVLLRRLSVFAGGWTLEAAEAVCAGEVIEEWETLDLLTQLMDKSLVAMEERGTGEARYSLLETVRQYSQEKRQQSGEDEAVWPRYLGFFLQLAETAAPNLDGPEQALWFNRLETEHDNLRAAIEGLLTDSRAAEAARLSLALREFWWQRGWIPEGRSVLARCLAHEEDLLEPRCRADLLQASGWSAYLQADYEQASQHLEQALGLCRELGDVGGEATALNELALTAWAQGRATDARDQLDRSLALARQLGDEVKQAARLSNLGLLAIQAGEIEQARGYLVEAQEIYDRRQNIHGKAASLCNLAELALSQKEWEQAETYSQQSLEQFRLLDDRYGVALTLANLSEIAIHRANHAAAEQYLREALALCVEIGRRGLIPHLLEIRARNQGVIGTAEQVCFSLTAAERLRQEFSTPRCSEEGEAIDPALAELLATLDEQRRDAVQAGIAQLTLDGLIAEILKPLSPGARDLAVSVA